MRPSMPKRVKDPRGKSQVLKRSVSVDTHKTSVALEAAFWDGLKDIAAAQRIPISHLLAAINRERLHTNLSSAIRLFVLEYYRSRCSPDRPDDGAPFDLKENRFLRGRAFGGQCIEPHDPYSSKPFPDTFDLETW